MGVIVLIAFLMAAAFALLMGHTAGSREKVPGALTFSTRFAACSISTMAALIAWHVLFDGRGIWSEMALVGLSVGVGTLLFSFARSRAASKK